MLDRIGLKIKDTNILDPCCGTGVIGRVLRNNGFNNITEIDIQKGQDFLEYDKKNEHHIIIANPPYSIKDDFIKKAIEISMISVYMILPYNVGNYNGFHRNYLNYPEYEGKYLLTPKFWMTEEETNNPKKGGMSAYAWFKWSNFSNSYDPSKKEVSSWERYIDLVREGYIK